MFAAVSSLRANLHKNLRKVSSKTLFFDFFEKMILSSGDKFTFFVPNCGDERSIPTTDKFFQGFYIQSSTQRTFIEFKKGEAKVRILPPDFFLFVCNEMY